MRMMLVDLGDGHTAAIIVDGPASRIDQLIKDVCTLPTRVPGAKGAHADREPRPRRGGRPANHNASRWQRVGRRAITCGRRRHA
jgi:hypothetical protein